MLLLMTQSVAAAVSNWMVDKILYQAQMHPAKKVKDVNSKDIESVFDAMIP